MNLIRMLAKARSLMGVGEGPARYEVVSNQGEWVPQFYRGGQGPGSGKEEPSEAGPDRERDHGNVGKASLADPRQAELNMKTEDRADGEKHGRWLARSLGPRPILRADSKGQLSLEFVKVVRNDLSDSDLELVPSRTVTRPGWASPASIPSPVLEAKESVAAVGVTRAVGAEALGVGSGSGSIEPEASRWSRFRSKIFGVVNPG